jgi:uncharacterized protein YgiM (DUF1202 family)
LIALAVTLLVLVPTASAQGTPTITLDPTSGPPNTQVWLDASGFPPLSTISIWQAPANSEGRLVTQGMTDSHGGYRVRLLAEGAPAMTLVFAAIGPTEQHAEARFTIVSGSGTVETDVQRIEALSSLNVRSGPGLRYRVIGRMRQGEIADVTGLSPDRQWWQIRCTQGRDDLCWVRARADLTQPVPGPDDTPFPVRQTEVEYVMALTDVNVRRGPGIAYPVINQVYGGQIAKVTGVSVRGDWWRIECPDASSYNCWITAKPQYTQPADPRF